MTREELAEYGGEDRVVTFGELQDELSKITTPIFSLRSNLPMLDKLIGGFEAGELIVVSGKAKSGKSLLCQSFTQTFQNKFSEPTCWFSYEMPPRQFFSRFEVLPALACMPRKMELSNLQWLEQRMIEARLKFDVKVYIIDHLHFLFDMSKIRNSSLEIGAVLRKLKTIAIQQDCIIFIVCHMQKTIAGKEPEGEEIRDSSFVLCEPDTVLMLWRLEDDEINGIQDEAVLKVVMTRRTGVFSRRIPLKKVGGVLCEKASLGAGDEPRKRSFYGGESNDAG